MKASLKTLIAGTAFAVLAAAGVAQAAWPERPVTIIVPAFNEGPVIEPSVRSLLQLDYPAYEILVVDDGSTDDTRERVAPLEGRHGDVTVRLVSKMNGGKASALSTLVAEFHRRLG